ncbi:MAG: ribbon-helix-helix protein, CopG family [Bifidobacteriaceae bacterium]|jgi:predicted transcriptional regulator|nr:ribbon-helix-helix protein, CopG family [Bifidobacteriaceae bacterium]
MNKTSIYLDDERKAKLDRVASITGRTRADLIREGIDHVTGQGLPRSSRLLARRASLGGDTQTLVDAALEGFGQ